MLIAYLIFRHVHLRIVNDANSYDDGYLTEDFTTAVINTNTGIKVLDIESQSFATDYDMLPGSRVLSCAANVMICASSDPSSCGEVWMRNLFHQTENSRSRICLHSQQVSCARISREHEYVFTAGDDGTLCISNLHHRLFPQREYKYNEDVGPVILKDFLVSTQELEENDRYIVSLQEQVSVKNYNEGSVLIVNHHYYSDRVFFICNLGEQYQA